MSPELELRYLGGTVEGGFLIPIVPRNVSKLSEQQSPDIQQFFFFFLSIVKASLLNVFLQRSDCDNLSEQGTVSRLLRSFGAAPL